MAEYIDKDVLARYWEVGGVRIEDNIHITTEGYENLTDTPKLRQSGLYTQMADLEIDAAK